MITFQINRSEINGRIDPKFILYLKNIHSFKYKVQSLKNFLLETPQYGTAETSIPRTCENQPRYIRITDIDVFGELDNSLGATAKKSSIEYFLNSNDILFARSGATVGKTYLHKQLPYPAFFAGYMIRFRVDGTKLLPDYLFAYTHTTFYKSWVDAIQRTAAQPNINAEEFASLPIPLPPLPIQKIIALLYTKTQNQRKNNLIEAQGFIDNSDKYLLNEIGITLPQKDNSLKNRIFTTSFRNVIGNRIDPLANSPILESLRSNLSNSSFTYLKNIVTETKAIETEINPTDIYVGLENIESNTGKYIPTETKDSISSALRFKKGQILFPKLRPYLNKVYLAEFDGLCSTEFHVFDAKNIDVHFLHYCLLSKITLAQTSNLMTGNTLPRLQSSDIAHILIPNPPIEKQKEIAKHIQNIRNQAKQLEIDAETKYKQAMQKIEQMIMENN